MDRSQRYIGSPNGIVLCIDRVEAKNQISGRFYHRYQREGTAFRNTEQMLFGFEQFFDRIQFPYPTTSERTFQERAVEEKVSQERAEKMSDEELLRKHGELGTFVVRVQHRENSSWQGRITWMEKNRTLYFRSAWELLKMIASAVETTGEAAEEPEEKEPSWFDEEE